MIKKVIVLLTLLLFVSLKMQAQTNAVSIGGEASGAGGTGSFTVGEVFYSYKTNERTSVSEGVQQGHLQNPMAVLRGNATLCAGSATQLSISLTGTGPWSGTISDGTSFSGENSPILVSVLTTANTTYTITTLTDVLGSATASDLFGSATVIVNSNAITVQPLTTPICKLVGATASISVVAAASVSPGYKWYSQASTATSTSSWVLLSDNANYTGTGSAKLSITRSTVAIPATGTKYRVEVSGNGCEAVMSAVVPLIDQTVFSKATAITAKTATNTALSPALTVCEGSTLNLSIAKGSVGNMQWMYSSDSGATWDLFTSYSQSSMSVANGVLTSISPVLAAGTAWFKVVASNGVCTSVDSDILKLTVSAPPTLGTIVGGDVTVCAPLAIGFDDTGDALTEPITSSTTLSLNGVSLGASIVWQKCINYTAATPIWTKVSDATTSSYTASDVTVDTWFRALVSNGACSGYSNTVKITVTKLAKAGATTSASTVCVGGDISFTSAAYTGSAIQWQVSSISAAGPYTDIIGATTYSCTLTGVSYPALSKFYVRSRVTNGSCTAAFSTVKTITVNPLSVAGTLTGGGTVCNVGVAGILKMSGNTGGIQWQYSTDGGETYTNAPSSAGTAPTFSTTSTGIAATYIVSNVTADTYFRALVGTGACSSAVSNAVAYVVASSAIAGTVSAISTTVCSGTGTTISLSGSLGVITWQKSINWSASAPTWTNVTNAVRSTLNTGNITASTAYRAIVSIGLCFTLTSDKVVVNVPLAPVSKVITATATTPAGTTAKAAICTSSAVKVLSIAAGSIGSIQWQSSTTSATAGFSDILGAKGSNYLINNASAGANYYRATFTNSCGLSVTTAAITVYYKECTQVIARVKEELANFGVIASPNPFTESFNLNLTTASKDKVTVMVYDMLGKLIETREFSPSEVLELQVGARYASGVYNVILTQGENAKKLLVIKQ